MKIRKHSLSLYFRAWFFRALLLFNLIPLGIIAIYDHASADDYAFSNYPHHAWEAAHSLIAFLGGCMKQFHWNYFSWQGCYSAVVLGTLDPLAFGTEYYVLVPWILVGLLVLSNFVFWRTLSFHITCYQRTAGENGKWDSSVRRKWRAYGDIAASVSCLIQIELVPRALDMFFWWDGGVNYLPFFAFMLLLGAALIRLYDKGTMPAGLIAASCVLSFVFVGGNYATALVNILSLAAFGLLLLYRQKKISIPYLLMLGSAVTGLLVSVLAPGNTARVGEEGAAGITSIPALVRTSLRLSVDSIQGSFTLLLLLFLAMLIPFFGEMTASLKERSGEPAVLKLPFWLVYIVLFLIYASSFAPSVYVYGGTGPQRVEDVRYFYLTFFLIIGEFYTVAKIQWKLSEKSHASLQTPRFMAGVLILTVLLTVFYYLIPRENREVLTSVCAARSLLIGEAQQYDLDMKEQERLLSDPSTKGQDIVLQAATAHPRLLYLSGLEITDDPGNWINQTVAGYYDKNSVVLTGIAESDESAAGQ